MTLQFKNLNVASLDYSSIVNSIKSFLKQEPTLSNLDYDNSSSAVSMLINILATATAYNGVYAQFGYKESFLSTANLLESIVGLASNSSVLLEVKKSASTKVNIQTSSSALDEYTPFNATATDGSSTLFFNIESIPASSAKTISLYSGTEVGQYTNWNFTTNSMVLPLSVDPATINFYTVDLGGVETKWTRVYKSDENSPANQNYFTVINTVNGYLVTTNLPESAAIDTSLTVYAKAIVSNGAKSNDASIEEIAGVSFLTTPDPIGGYDYLTAAQARAKARFAATSQHRCVTRTDYENAILNSGIGDINEESTITVENGNQPCTLKIYVDGLSTENSVRLMNYLSERSVAGINLVYEQ